MTVAWKRKDAGRINGDGGGKGGSENAGPAKGEGPPAHPTLGTFCGTPPPHFAGPAKGAGPGTPQKAAPGTPQKHPPAQFTLAEFGTPQFAGPHFAGSRKSTPPPKATPGPRTSYLSRIRHPPPPNLRDPAKGSPPRDPFCGTPQKAPP